MAKPKVYLSVSYQADGMLVSIAERELQLAGVEIVRYDSSIQGWTKKHQQDLIACNAMLIIPPQISKICLRLLNGDRAYEINVGLGQSNAISQYLKDNWSGKIGIMDDSCSVFRYLSKTSVNTSLANPQNKHSIISMYYAPHTIAEWLLKTIPTYTAPISSYETDLNDCIAEAKGSSSNQISNDLPELDAALKEYKINIHTNGSTNTQYIPNIGYISNGSSLRGNIADSINLSKTPTYSSENNYKIAATAIAIQDEPKITSSDTIKPMLALYALLKF